MRKIKTLGLALLLSLVFFGCTPDSNHLIRVRNQLSESITLRIGSVNYGSVNSGSTTDYKSVGEGSHTISGNSESGNQLSGSLSVSGEGTHKWTFTILSDGGSNFVED